MENMAEVWVFNYKVLGYNQCFGSGSAWIRIKVRHPGSGYGSALEMRIPYPDPGALKSLKNGKYLIFFSRLL